MAFDSIPRGTVPIRALIVDDEPLARRRIRRLLEREPDVEVIGECSDGGEALQSIRARRPDLVFLDVQMPVMDGIQVLQSVGSLPMPAVVFVTAYDQYTLQAFDSCALDYLLKPFEEDRFRESVRRARERLNQGADGKELRTLLQRLRERSYLDRLLVKSRNGLVFLRVDCLRWIEAAGNRVRLHVAGEAHLLRSTMAAMEARLDPSRFLRVSRSAIVNLDAVKEIQPWFHGDYVVILRDGTRIPLSRGYRAKLEALWSTSP